MPVNYQLRYAVLYSGINNVMKISKEFDRISENNFSIQKDIADILKTTETYGNASEPLQIMCLAFKEKP